MFKRMLRKTKSFAFYCSKGASRIIKFYSIEENLLKYRPKKVIYDGERDNIIEELKKKFGTDLVLFEKRNYNSLELKNIHSLTSQFIHKTLKDFNIEYLLCYGEKILKKELIYSYHQKLINFHPSVLPSFRGLKAIDQAFDNGSVILGNTAYYIDEGIDTGRIILQTAMLSEDFENYEDVLELQFPMLKMILRDLLNYPIMEVDIFKELIDRKKQYLIPKKCIL